MRQGVAYWLHIIPSKGNTMPTIKFRPHAVVTYYNGSREAVFVVQVFGESLAVHSQFIYQFDEDLCWYRLLG